MKKIAAAGAFLALAACTSGDPPDPHSDAGLRATHARIVASANSQIFGDGVYYRGPDAEVERESGKCLGAKCTLGFRRALAPQESHSVEPVALEYHGQFNGIDVVVEVGEDVGVYGGWMRHSFFGVQTNIWTDETDPNEGYVRILPYAVGDAPGTNPEIEDTVRWRGLMYGYSYAPADRGQAYRGDAEIRVDLGQTGMEADVFFENIRNQQTDAARDDMLWRNVRVLNGRFARHVEVGNSLSGRFYGRNHEETAGVFERESIVGAFGGKR